jgi:fucose 4-O-acetylase-like acetyltransferase
LNSNTLTFEQTNRLKGLLILLIVFGHISQLLEQLGELHATLYSFHVVSFLLLPFLFNKDHFTISNIKKNIRRIYVPYTLFFLLSLIIFSLLEKQFNPFSALSAWCIGSSALLKIDTGFRIFWFFPALMSTVLLLMTYNSLSLKNKKILLLFMLLLHYSIPFIPKTYLFYFPLSSYISFYLFIIGVTVKYLYEHLDYSKYSWHISGLFIGLLIIAYGSDFSLASAIFPNIKEHTFNFIVQDLIMIISFFALILWSRKIKLLETFGHHSLAIFTIHPFIIQALNKLYTWESFKEGLVKFILVILINYLIIKIIYYFNFNKILYPR